MKRAPSQPRTMISQWLHCGFMDWFQWVVVLVSLAYGFAFAPVLTVAILAAPALLYLRAKAKRALKHLRRPRPP